MTYLLKPTNKRSFLSRNFFKIWPLVVAVVAIFALSAVEPLGFAARSFLSPFFKAGDSVYGGTGIMPGFFSEKMALTEENRNLREEIEKTRAGLADYGAIKYENERLREEMQFKPTGEFITASVLARPPQLPLDSILIDRGGADGVKEGDRILAGERTLIGKVMKLSNNSASVALNSFAGSATYGYVARTAEPIEMKGDGGGSVKAKVPIDFDIEAGDQVMVPGPAPYLAAVVGMIEEDESSGFKEVFMSLPVNVSKTNVVFIEPAN